MSELIGDTPERRRQVSADLARWGYFHPVKHPTAESKPATSLADAVKNIRDLRYGPELTRDLQESSGPVNDLSSEEDYATD